MACLKRVAPLAIVACLLQFAWGQPPAEAPKPMRSVEALVETLEVQEERANTFWERLQEQKIDGAAELLSPGLREELGETGPKRILEECEAVLGSFNHGSGYRFWWCGDIPVQRGEIEWEQAGDTRVQLSFDNHRRIDGIWVDSETERTPPLAWGELATFAREAVHSLTVQVVTPEGEPPSKSMITIWRAVDPQTIPQRWRDSMWRDPATEKAWTHVSTTGTGDSTTQEKLVPGTYRATAREGHQERGAMGISEPVEIGGEKREYETAITLLDGGRLTVRLIDAVTTRPVHGAGAVLNLRDPRYPEMRFVANESDATELVFDDLPPGKYELFAKRSAGSPDSMVFEMENGGPLEIVITEKTDKTIDVPLRGRLRTPEEISEHWGWTAFGQVLDPDGKPIPDVEVRVATGYGTLLGGGSTTTAWDGGYRLRFGEGIWMDHPANLQIASFGVSKPGYVELERTSSVNSMARLRMPDAEKGEDQDGWGNEVVIKGEPYRLDFILAPAVTLKVTLVDAQGRPLDTGNLEEASPDTSAGSEHREDEQWELLAGVDWWFTYSDEKLQIPWARTQPFQLPATGDYAMRIRALPRPKTGAHVLEILSVTNSEGEDITEEVVGDDPAARPVVSDELQRKGREILKKLAERNSHWLTFDPQPVESYSYTFHLEGNEPQRFTIMPESPDSRVMRHGISHVSALHALVEDPSRVTFRQVDVGEDEIVLTYALAERVGISAGNGVHGTWRGFFSTWQREGRLVIDAQRLVPIRHTGLGRDPVRETFSQFHEITPEKWAPLAIEVDGSHHYRWTFQSFEEGLWLFAASYVSDDDGGWNTIAHIEEVQIAERPATAVAMGQPEWAK